MHRLYFGPVSPGKPADKAVSEDSESEAGQGEAVGKLGLDAAKPAGSRERASCSRSIRRTLAELDAKAKWEDQPVVDTHEAAARAASQGEAAGHGRRGAASLRTTRQQANAKILSALGRLPESDADVELRRPHHPAHAGGDVKSTNPI